MLVMSTDNIKGRIMRLLYAMLLLVGQTTGKIIEGDIYVEGNQEAARQSSSLQTSTWPAGRVPFVIDGTLYRAARGNVLIAMQYIQGNTTGCVSFQPRTTSDMDYINISSSTSGCYSSVGHKGGAQPVNIGPGCNTVGIIMHELLHALGFWHEQSRTDRDNFVNIYLENVTIGRYGEFKIQSQTTDVVNNVPYDYWSILHYKYNQFAKMSSLDTIVPKNKNVAKTVLGQRERLSENDVKRIMWLYKCDDCTTPDYMNVIVSPSRKTNSYVHGEQVSLSCSRYVKRVLIGPKTSTCLHGSQWSGATPFCIEATEHFIYCDMNECLGQWRKTANWQPNSGSSATVNGPAVDHTDQTATGSYLLFGSRDGVTSQIAYAQTPPYRQYREQTTSLMFYYYMYGTDVNTTGELTVYQSQSRKPIWTNTGTTTEPKWYKVITTVSTRDFFQILFVAEGTMNIAIDDVFMGPSSKIDMYDQSTTDAQTTTKSKEYDSGL